MIWTDQVLWAIYHTPKKEMRLPWEPERLWAIDTPANKAAAIRYIKNYMKKLPDERRRSHLADMLDALDVQESLQQAERQMLNWDEVRDSMDLVTYGGHTHTHPIMSRLDRAGLDREIRVCRDRIEQETGVRPTYFAYPNGTEADFTDDCKTALKHHGFDVAFSTIEGINPVGTDTMALRRRHGETTNVPDFVWQISRPIN
jgi:peptidoglycan/xylan/chitin deacetylase (PgdA/CDA1 family)